MAEYWKSLPRKFCDVCKCWFADNKASIQFHERGKRHQENAQKRIQDIQKRGIKEFKKQKELENEMAKIEKAALAAYQKDLAGDNKSDSNSAKFPNNNYLEPSAKAVKSSLETVQKKISEKLYKVKSEEPPPLETPTPTKVWYEAETEDGYKYYWNTEDSDSQWEPPDVGYVTLEEQKNQTDDATVSEGPKKSEENSSEVKEDETSSGAKEDETSSESKDEDSSESKEGDSSVPKENKSKNDPVPISFGPQPKYEPYGQWVTIKKEEPLEYDLQLPEQSEDIVHVAIPLHNDGPSLKFKEKVVGQLSDSETGEVTFKKRKFGAAFKRNTRQRTMDDD